MKQQNQQPDSFTKVNFRLDGERETVGFKCNKKLWKAFVRFSKREYGSVCHILEPIILAILTSKVNQSKTIKPIVIENLRVERAVKRVRRYSVEDSNSGRQFYCALDNVYVPFESLPLQKCLNCSNNACRKYVMGLADREVVSNE